MSTSYLVSLPPEILIIIYEKLPVRDGCNLSGTCKKLFDIFQDELIWEKKTLLDYGNFKHEYLRSRAYICLSLSSPSLS